MLQSERSASVAEGQFSDGTGPTERLLARLATRLDRANISSDAATRKQYSQDYYWYSPILKEQLQDKTADLVAWPSSQDELRDVLRTAYEERVPVTIRGGGTGNYGQCIPLQGGLVIDTSRLTAILEIGTGYARVEAGTRLGILERAVNETGQELCIYPSTFLTSSAAGFIGGGSGGIGSIAHGMLWDGNAMGATILPMNGSSEPMTVSGDGVTDIIHAYGTTAVMADVTLRLAPRVEWVQMILTFPTLADGSDFCNRICTDDSIDKRLVTLNAQGIVAYFNRTKRLFPDDGTLVFLYIRKGQEEDVRRHAVSYGGTVHDILPGDAKMRLSDFTWNHTTLYGIKADPRITYLQSQFDPERRADQLAEVERVLGPTFLVHLEYLRNRGEQLPAMLPLFPYEGPERLREMIAFLRSIGCSVANPHTYVLEEGGMDAGADRLLATKQKWDPGMLLNPGKLKSAATLEAAR